jgi:hypothetical protein
VSVDRRIAEVSVVAKHVPAVGQLTFVTLALLSVLSVLQCVPPSVVVASSPDNPTALHVLTLGQLMALNDLVLPANGSVATSKLSDQEAPAFVVT